MKKLLSLSLIIVLSACLLKSCKKDNGEPPVLPPLESMTIDFANFTDQIKSANFISDQKGTENSSWNFAAGAAIIWRGIIFTTLAIPVTSFKLAIDQDPVFLSEKTWQWSYNVTVASVLYKARLTGELGATDVIWKMYITKDGAGATEFNWFNGTSKLDGTGGQWILNESSQSPTPFLQIDWTQTGTSIGTIKYTYLKNDSYKTSYIEYGLTTGTLNAKYKIYYYNGVKFSDIDVEWSTSVHNGRVKSIDYLGDNLWHCWDANKIKQYLHLKTSRVSYKTECKVLNINLIHFPSF